MAPSFSGSEKIASFHGSPEGEPLCRFNVIFEHLCPTEVNGLILDVETASASCMMSYEVDVDMLMCCCCGSLSSCFSEVHMILISALATSLYSKEAMIIRRWGVETNF